MDEYASERLRKALLIKGITQRELAKRLNVTEQYVSLILNGSKPATEKICAKACNAIGIDYMWLTEGIGRMEAIPENLTDIGYLTARLIDVPADDPRRRLAMAVAKMSETQIRAFDEFISVYLQTKKEAEE